jgi:ABC-type lipopolysaccharide export system ATPase subunit
LASKIRLYEIFQLSNNIFHFTVGNLSLGLARLIEDLLILYSKASYSLLDEPFVELSPLYIELFKEQFSYMRQYKGILIADHSYRDIMDVSDEIQLMKEGTLLKINGKEHLVLHEYLSESE